MGSRTTPYSRHRVPSLSARADPAQQEGQTAMPEEPQIDEIDPQQPNESREDYLVRVERSRLRQLEASAKRGDEAEARAVAAERRLAFAEAGINLSSTDEKVRFFIEGYQGELDAAAIKAKAEAFGVLTPATPPPPAATTEPPTTPPPPEATPLLPGEADQTQQRRDLFQGAPPDQPAPADPYQDAARIHEQVLKDGGQEKQALGAALNSLANAAARGDERVILGRRAGLTPATGSLGD